MKAIITICNDASGLDLEDIEIDTNELSFDEDAKEIDDAQRYRDLTS